MSVSLKIRVVLAVLLVAIAFQRLTAQFAPDAASTLVGAGQEAAGYGIRSYRVFRPDVDAAASYATFAVRLLGESDSSKRDVALGTFSHRVPLVLPEPQADGNRYSDHKTSLEWQGRQITFEATGRHMRLTSGDTVLVDQEGAAPSREAEDAVARFGDMLSLMGAIQADIAPLVAKVLHKGDGPQSLGPRTTFSAIRGIAYKLLPAAWTGATPSRDSASLFRDDGPVCSDNSYSSRCYGTTRSVACSCAQGDVMGLCSNEYCWGCCGGNTNCDCACALGDFLCYCLGSGYSCGPPPILPLTSRGTRR
jgi:hypothetical protein